MSKIDRAYLEIEGDQILCESVGIDMEDGSAFVEAMTPDNEPLGFSRGNRKYTVTADVTMDESDPVDFHQIWADGDEFTAEVQYEGGLTYAWNRCILTSLSTKSQTGDKTTYSLSMLCMGLQVS